MREGRLNVGHRPFGRIQTRALFDRAMTVQVTRRVVGRVRISVVKSAAPATGVAAADVGGNGSVVVVVVIRGAVLAGGQVGGAEVLAQVAGTV